MDKINRGCSLFSFFINNWVLLNKERRICNMDTNFINFFIFYFTEIKLKIIEIIIIKSSDRKSVIKISGSQWVNRENSLFSKISSVSNFLRWNLILTVSISLWDKFSQARLYLCLSILLFINVMCFQQGIGFYFDFTKSTVLSYDCTFWILRVSFPIVKLYNEIFLVDFFQPWSLDFVHSHIHCNKTFVDWGNVIQSLFLKEINSSYDLSLHIGWYDRNDFAVCFQWCLIHNLKVNFILMHTSVSVLSLNNQSSIHF